MTTNAAVIITIIIAIIVWIPKISRSRSVQLGRLKLSLSRDLQGLIIQGRLDIFCNVPTDSSGVAT